MLIRFLRDKNYCFIDAKYCIFHKLLFLADPESPDGSKWERNIPPPPHVSILLDLVNEIFNSHGQCQCLF